MCYLAKQIFREGAMMEFIKEYDLFNINKKNVLVNYLTGACDLIDDELREQITTGQIDRISHDNINGLLSRRYLFRNYNEYQSFLDEINKKLEYDDNRACPNFLIIPSYSCNLRCAYCFEQKYSFSPINPDKEWTSTAFRFINHVVDGYKEKIAAVDFDPCEIVITLMGGEPLLKENYNEVLEIVKFVQKNQFSYNIITNGVNISEYMELFQWIKPINVQVTLDGTMSIHDSRRKTKNGEGTFFTIIKNIHALLEIEVPVYIRMNVDKDNVMCIREFIDFLHSEFGNNRLCIPYLYPVQDGGCAYESTVLDEISVIMSIQELEASGYSLEDISCIFHGSAFVNSIQSNSIPSLKIRNCAANKGQYILDLSGLVYKCWFGVGNRNFSIGEYRNLDTAQNDKDKLWMSRTVNQVEKCMGCKYRYLCGCGCLSHVFENTDDILKPQCNDFYTLIEMQLRHALRKKL